MKNKMMLSLATLVVASLVASSGVSAAVLTVANDNVSRTLVDTYNNFTVVDTNNPATATGTLSQFKYWASNTNPFRFVVVDSSNVVQWVSDQVTPSAVGMNVFNPLTPAPIQTGDNVGLYFTSTGTIPFESTGVASYATANNVGMPTVGSTLALSNVNSRTYSFVATGTVAPVLTSVNATPATATINVGATQQLTSSPLDQDSMAFVGATVTYSSSNTAVATVSNSGLVTGVSVGTATITTTATSGSITVSDTSTINVVKVNGDNDEHEDEYENENGHIHEHTHLHWIDAQGHEHETEYEYESENNEHDEHSDN